MKLYGEKRNHHEDNCTNMDGWSGTQSKKIARRRKKDKKKLHREIRRVMKNDLKNGIIV